MNLQSDMQMCMVTLDLARAKQIWKQAFPHLAPIVSDRDMLATLHLARTQSAGVSERLRFYSHQWLLERNHPSALPDHLRPAAERMYPRKQESVGISVNSSSDLFKPIIPMVRSAMENAVLDVYADGKSDDTKLIKRRMTEARRTTVKKLLGI